MRVRRLICALLKAVGTLAGLTAFYVGFLALASWLYPADAIDLSDPAWWEGEARGTWEEILRDYASSVNLYATAVAAICGLGLPLGIFWGGIRSGLIRGVAGAGALVLASAPAFVVAYLCIYGCLEILGVPVMREIGGGSAGETASGFRERALAGFWFVLLPAGVLSIPGIGRVAGEIGGAVSKNMMGPAMIPLRSRGLSRGRRLYRYALPASWWAVFRSLREVLPTVIGGSLIVEWIFHYPGLGTRCFEAVREREYHILFAAALLLALTVLVLRLILDFTEALLVEEDEKG